MNNITAALEALKREFDATTGMRAGLTNNTLVVHVIMREAFHGKPWRIAWEYCDEDSVWKRSLEYLGGDSFRRNDQCVLVNDVTRQEAEEILNTSTMRVEAPATVTDGTIDPDTQRMLDFATNLDYLTTTGRSTLLPVRLMWEL